MGFADTNTTTPDNTTAYGIVQTNPDEAESLEWKEIEKPQPSEGEALVRVRFAGVNRADTLQAQGHYPPPQGVTDVIGLEVTGVIEDPNGTTKPDGSAWKKGEEVAALLSGGGYATHVVVPQGQLLPIPEGFSLAQTASIVEVACTVWQPHRCGRHETRRSRSAARRWRRNRNLRHPIRHSHGRGSGRYRREPGETGRVPQLRRDHAD